MTKEAVKVVRRENITAPLRDHHSEEVQSHNDFLIKYITKNKGKLNIVTGMTASGKTLLAMQIASLTMKEFEDSHILYVSDEMSYNKAIDSLYPYMTDSNIPLEQVEDRFTFTHKLTAPKTLLEDVMRLLKRPLIKLDAPKTTVIIDTVVQKTKEDLEEFQRVAEAMGLTIYVTVQTSPNSVRSSVSFLNGVNYLHIGK